MMSNFVSIGKISTKVTYLEMVRRPVHHHLPKPLVDNYSVKQVVPTIEFYRSLYHLVGETLNWSERKLLSDDELKEIIHSPNVHIFVLYLDDSAVGFIEFDLRNDPHDIELGLFGIGPDYYGKRLGVFLLNWGIEYVWTTLKAKRFWLHTCDLDHPKMLSTYLNCGFTRFDEQMEEVDQI